MKTKTKVILAALTAAISIGTSKAQIGGSYPHNPHGGSTIITPDGPIFVPSNGGVIITPDGPWFDYNLGHGYHTIHTPDGPIFVTPNR